MHTCMDGRMDRCMDARMHGCVDAWRKVQPRKRGNQHFVVVASGGCRDRISFFSFSWLQFLVHIPKNPSDEARKNAKGALLKTLAPNPQIYLKSFPNLSKTVPNLPKTLPNRRKLKVQPRKQKKLTKKCLGSMSLTLLGRILGAQSFSREAQEPPKSSQNGAKIMKKWMLKNKSFSDSIFSWFGGRFWWFFGWFLDAKNYQNCWNTIFAKTWKIVIFLRKNWYFQGFEGLKRKGTSIKKQQN